MIEPGRDWEASRALSIQREKAPGQVGSAAIHERKPWEPRPPRGVVRLIRLWRRIRAYAPLGLLWI